MLEPVYFEWGARNPSSFFGNSQRSYILVISEILSNFVKWSAILKNELLAHNVIFLEVLMSECFKYLI